MTLFSVDIVPKAQERVRLIISWWYEKRLKNPTLFEDVSMIALFEGKRRKMFAGRRAA